MSGEPEFDGTEITLGRTKYVVPPLALGAIKKHLARIQNFPQLPLPEQMELTSQIALAALKRNYPDMTLDKVDELIDMRNMREVFDAVVQTSGFTAKPADAGNGAGETSQLTGKPSTPS